MKILYALFSYAIGSFPTGYFLYFLSEKKDIRKFGSHSIGATNVLRLKGWKFALPVAVIDTLKGFLPVYFALKFFQDTQFALLCGFLAVLGHCFPIYLKLKGGKGVATAVGVYAAVAFKPLLIGLAIFLIIIFFTRYVSLGSLAAVLSLPVSILILQKDSAITLMGIVIFLVILARHTGNIRRLLRGKEKKLGEKAQ